MALHPNGVNHLAISTTDMKAQLTFFAQVLGCPTKALYWMHGVDGCYHGFAELSADSYVAFVQHPDNSEKIEWGITHAGNGALPVTRGTMQHVAFNVDSSEELLAMRDRIRANNIQVLGPLDHGFIQSIYFAGPEGLSLEICVGSDIDEEAWIDPEVKDLCEITDAEMKALKNPEEYKSADELLPNPDFDGSQPHMHYPPGILEKVMSVPDEVVWERFSETQPPVVNQAMKS
ncbi:MAG: glyoxalase [Actinobacteria bacterium]|mgnify:FL=1|jgi:catechol 2,3-dioxygenase-like lactoylglutathione lyase family enzyme|nr:glyoxalase [Actinomycetota bacterium]|tara:strand:+ start:827 stop:1522 length:696 start_codon:yes stop_codon:yes gene_type:complete